MQKLVHGDVAGYLDGGFANFVEEVDMSGITFSGKTTQFWFGNFRSLKTVKNFNTTGVETFNGTFYNCSSLETVPTFDDSSIKNWTGCFQGCTNLKNIPVLDFFRVAMMSYLQNAFKDCPSLTTDSLRNILTSCKAVGASGSNRKLSYIGLSQEQANICVTLNEWSSLSTRGWTTGF